MNRYLFCVMWVALIASPLEVAEAQNFGVLWLHATCVDSANVVTLSARDNGGLPELVGFDIYKRALADCGGEYVRITEDPLLRGYGVEFQRAVTDADVEPETMYCYRVVGVNEERETLSSLWPAYFEPDIVSMSCSSCGMAPIARGTLFEQGWWKVSPCAGACLDISDKIHPPTPVDLAAWALSGLSLVFYGTVGCGTIEGCFMEVESVVPLDCDVEVDRATWSTVKRLFR